MERLVKYEAATQYVVYAFFVYVLVCVCVCVSSHLWHEQERRSLLAQEKLGAEESWLAHFHTLA